MILTENDTKPNFLHYELSGLVLGCCFEVMNELGVGFLESVYKNALCIALREKQLFVETEKTFDVNFRKQKIGFYRADIIDNNLIIVELKCCKQLLAEHKAQIINYLVASELPVGLLVNFNSKDIEYNRMHNPNLLQD